MMEKKEFSRLVSRAGRELQRGQIDQSIELLEQLLADDPSDFDALLTMSAAKILSKKFREAVVILEPLAEGHPDNPVVWSNLGAAYLGNPVLANEAAQFNAVSAFVRALEIDPLSPHTAYNIGLIHKDRKEYEVAISWFEIALQTNPKDEDASYWIKKLRLIGLEEDQP